MLAYHDRDIKHGNIEPEYILMSDKNLGVWLDHADLFGKAGGADYGNQSIASNNIVWSCLAPGVPEKSTT